MEKETANIKVPQQVNIPAEVFDFVGNRLAQEVFKFRVLENSMAQKIKEFDELKEKLQQSQEQNERLVNLVEEGQAIIDRYEKMINNIGVK